ncbi:MAG: glycosyltransferase family 4 protein [Candidatus Cloacimonetes bacterium]|nr:glycosyltransferase family 4 protein [Candidatus Cloacimonadota bacterium]
MRILLISYYFPPCGGAAVQRWLKWLPELVDAGFEVTVLTTEGGDHPVQDTSLLKEIPPEVRVLRSEAPSLSKFWKLLFGEKSELPHGSLDLETNASPLKKALVWTRLNLIIPDVRKIWNPSALRHATRFLRKNPVDLVITTGPPHSTHLVGLKLKQRHNVKWVADWRDPWSSIYYLKLNPPSKFSLNLQRRLEQKVAKSADLNIAVSNHLASQLPSKNTEVIYSGFQPVPVSEAEEKTSKYRIKYVGNLTEGQRFEEAVKLIKNALAGKDFELRFVGTALSQNQRKFLADNLPGQHSISGFLPHQQALAEIADCELLLLLINYYDGFQGMLTSKLFEYIGSGNRIFCLGPRGGEAEELINKYGHGACFDVDETALAGAKLKSLYEAWEAGENDKNQADNAELSSARQAQKLIALLRGLNKC